MYHAAALRPYFRTSPLLTAILITILPASMSTGTAVAAEPAALRLPASWPAPDPEVAALELACRLARRASSPATLDSLDRVLVSSHADEPWALADLARNLRVRHGSAAVRRMLSGRENLPPELAGLTSPALEVVRGTVEFLSDRFAGAAAAFERALVARPDWKYCHAYLYLCAAPLLKPLSYCQEQADACAGDASAMALVVQSLLWELSDQPEHPAFRDAARLCGESTGNSLAAATGLQLEVVREMRNAAPDARKMAEAWSTLVNRHGDLVWLHDDLAADEVLRDLPTREELSVLDECGRDPRGLGFRLRLIWRLAGLDRFVEAQRRLDATEWRTFEPRELRILVDLRVADGATIRAGLWAALEVRLPAQQSLAMREAADAAGDHDFWPAFWRELEREFPRGAMSHRLAAMSPGQADERTALLDSLERLSLFPDRFADDREHDRLVRGGGPTLTEILAVPDLRRRVGLLAGAADRAASSGNTAEAAAVLSARITAEAGEAIRLNGLLDEALDRADRPAADHALSSLANALPDDPLVELARIRHTLTFAGRAAAIDDLNAVACGQWDEPMPLASLAGMALYAGQHELAATIARRAVALAPRAFAPRLALADAVAARLEHAAADSLYRALAAEYPGSQMIAQRLLVSAASVTSLAATPQHSWNLEAAFRPFAYDLDDIDAVRAMAISGARADSMQADFCILQERFSNVLMDRSGSCVRHRRVLQVFSGAGADMARTQFVGFSPADGVPQLRVARVIAPDGTVTDVTRAEILIRAHTGDDGGVTDLREMVIPFTGLEPGGIIDLVYDSSSREYLAGGWSGVVMLAGGAPTREVLYEILAPPDAGLRVIAGPLVEPVTGYADPRIRAWRVIDAPIEEEENWAPAYLDRVPWIGLTTYLDWQSLGRDYGSSFWEVAVPDDAIRAEAARLCKGLRTREEKASALYRFVAEEINPLAVELGAGSIIPTPPAQVLARGWGDCKDCSTLLLALLDAAGIDARPVLVSTAGYMTPRRDLPTVSAFNHMIVQITGINGRPYCDPLNGSSCISPAPAASVGRPGLHLDRAGAVSLETVTEATADEHGYDMTVDLTPIGECAMRYDIACRSRGDAAAYLRGLTASNDTSVVREYLDSSVGFGVPAHIPLRSWSVEDLPCGELEIHMAYLDSAWANAAATSAEISCLNGGPVYWGLPPSEDRRNDVEFQAPYTAGFVLRLHGSGIWTPSGRLPQYASGDDLCSGQMKVETTSEGGWPLVVVTQDFRLERRRIPLQRYADFRRRALAHFMYGAAVYRFHKVLDEKLLERVLAYAEEFPDDHAFRVKAAAELLGTTYGGLDEVGTRRRDLARTLLEPALTQAASPLVIMIASLVECLDGRYARADSLVDAALAADPRDIQLLGLSVRLKRELEDLQGEISVLQSMINQTGSTELIASLIPALITAGRPEEAERQRQRLSMMGAPLDSLTLHMGRFLAFSRRQEFEAMAAELPALEPLIDGKNHDQLRVTMLHARELYSESLPILEKLLADNPTDAVICNNLSWSLAMLGQDLDRAEMLAEAASLMSSEPNVCLNTLGVVYARQGKWREARDLFRTLYRGDDRPNNRLANGYYLGICEMELGERDEGLRVWSEVENLPGDRMWRKRIEGGRRLLAEGGKPLTLAFAPPIAGLQ